MEIVDRRKFIQMGTSAAALYLTGIPSLVLATPINYHESYRLEGKIDSLNLDEEDKKVKGDIEMKVEGERRAADDIKKIKKKAVSQSWTPPRWLKAPRFHISSRRNGP